MLKITDNDWKQLKSDIDIMFISNEMPYELLYKEIKNNISKSSYKDIPEGKVMIIRRCASLVE